MALRAFIYLRAYGLRLANGVYGGCTQVNGKCCPHYIITHYAVTHRSTPYTGYGVA